MNDSQKFKILHENSLLISMAYSSSDLESICKEILKCFLKCNLNEINIMIKERISFGICSQIMVLINQKVELRDKVIDLMEYLLKNQMVDPIFIDTFKYKIRKFNFEPSRIIKQPLRKAQPNVFNDKEPLKIALIKNLNKLFTNNHDTEIYAKKKFGCSILNLTGDFLWADDKTMTVLNLRELENYKDRSNQKKKDEEKMDNHKFVNFFELMIPVCRAFLQHKFSSEIFSSELKIGEFKCFSYIIYNEANIFKCVQAAKEVNVN